MSGSNVSTSAVSVCVGGDYAAAACDYGAVAVGPNTAAAVSLLGAVAIGPDGVISRVGTKTDQTASEGDRAAPTT